MEVGLENTDLDENYTQALASLGTVRSYPKNTLLIHEGDRSDQLFVVQSGRLKVFLSDGEGKEIIVDVLGPGQYFGEMALDGETRSASVMTTEPSKLSIVQRAQFKKYLIENPDAAFSLIVALIRRARHLTRVVGDLALLDVYGRVARLLLDNAIEQDGKMVVADRLTQQEIGKRVGATRERVSRIISDLREGGYVSTSNNQIVIERSPPKKW